MLAYLMLPNVKCFACWGKALFSLCDLLTAVIYYRILALVFPKATDNVKNLGMVLFLFNPFVFSLSTRGSCDSLVSLILALFIYFLCLHEEEMKRQRVAYSGNLFVAALCFGLSVHLRIYPIIFVLPLFFHFQHFGEYIRFGIIAGSRQSVETSAFTLDHTLVRAHFF
jgi:phosphatidylinositol glycan class M